MKKWLFLFNYTLKLSFLYIFNEFLGSVYRLVSLLGVLVIGLQLTDPRYLMSYILTGSIFFSMTEPFISWDLGEKIKSGSLIKDLIYPTSVISTYFVRGLARCLYIFVSYIPVLLFLIFFFWSYFVLDLYKIWIFLPWFFVAMLIRYSLEFLSATVSFWTVEFTGPVYLVFNTMSILSGAIFPLSYLPLSFLWLKYLPFAFVLDHPMQIYLGIYDAKSSIYFYLLGILWAFALLFLSEKLFKFGLKKYESVGL